ncbi:MAG: PhnD/SsuA/transferrin family substrate-binding protein [Pirellulaceae bacterium]|nr:PhnD/SsuA/transferrin family substrate-binding protein [Pirellulaceae bacterium]
MKCIAAIAFGLLSLCGVFFGTGSVQAAEKEAWKLVVMDPMAAPLSCACVAGVGQRRYELLGAYLKQEMGLPVEITFDESLVLARSRMTSGADLVIGKRSVVEFDARRMGIQLTPIATLTDRKGLDNLAGLVVVRHDDNAKSLEDLKGSVIALGPEDSDEVHQAALELFRRHGAMVDWKFKTFASIDAAVYAVADGEAKGALVSDFLPPLLEGCGKIAKDSLRVIAATDPVPFVTLFALSHVSDGEVSDLRRTLQQVSKESALLTALESKDGFVMSEPSLTTTQWTDWRGPLRAGFSPDVPQKLSNNRILWTADATGPAMAGIAATEKFVVVADKSKDLTSDIFRCLDASTGESIWTIEYPADRELEYTNAPRANPLIADDLVYLSGALGDIHCAELSTGKIVWKANLLERFGAQPLNWGQCSPPLLVDGRLIVNPGAKQASLAALDAKTGITLWQTPGHAAAYGAFIEATLGGRRQIVGYDSSSLGGWDPGNGARLWTLVPPGASDFNVTTPIVVDGKILLATENNATRLYAMDDKGCIVPEPISENQDFAPDTCTPVVTDSCAFGNAYGEFFCLDVRHGLKTHWSVKDEMFYDHANLISGKDRVLVWTTTCDLLLLRASSERYEVVSHIRPFPEDSAESMSHPAIIKNRLFLRDQTRIICLSLE